MTESVDLKPTIMEYASMARVFREQILADIKKSRVDADRHVLRSLIEVMAYLYVTDRDQYNRVMNPLS